MNVRQVLKVGIAAMGLAGLVGCASTGGYEKPQVTLVDPSTMPKENWSDALTMFQDQMGIAGMQDATADSSHGTAAGLIDTSKQQGFGAEMGLIAQSAAAGALFFVMDSGPRNRMINHSQIAFWVPADKASSPEAAGQLVAEQWTAIRKELLAGRREAPVEQISISGYPVNHPKAFVSYKGELQNERPAFEEAPRVQTVGSQTGLFYGPIFVHQGSSWGTDLAGTRLPRLELLEAYAQKMPETAMLYYFGNSAPKIYEPAFVIQNKKKYFFKTPR